MKFVNIKGAQEVLSIEITVPELCKEYEYFYPDGITKGFWKENTYFLRWEYEYYLTPQEALQERDDENLFTKEGKIWTYGEVKTTLRSSGESILKYRNPGDLTSFLDVLEFRWGVDLHSLVCLETPEITSLYEFNNALRH